MRYRRNWIVPKGKELTDMDRKILFYQEHGHLVPSPKLIKTPEQIEGIRRSGKSTPECSTSWKRKYMPE